MDCGALLSNAFSAGALAAYFLACRQEKKRKIANYLSLLLLVYEQLYAVYSILANIPSELVKEVDGKKTVKFTMPLPKFELTPQQMQRLWKLHQISKCRPRYFNSSVFLICKHGV